jgi:hypothetical protein
VAVGAFGLIGRAHAAHGEGRSAYARQRYYCRQNKKRYPIHAPLLFIVKVYYFITIILFFYN